MRIENGDGRLALDNGTKRRVEKFVDLLMEWNRVHNLTGAKTREAVEAQVEDSLYPLTFLPRVPENLLDIGTGAGFPGLLLACAWPETQTTLCEPLQKRAAFLRYAARELGLEKLTVEARRVEALAPRAFDLITSRAVTETKELIAWCRPFIGKRTQLLFYKGERAPEEITGLEKCDIELVARGKRNYLWIKDAQTC